MKRPLILVLFAIVLIVVALGAFGVIPLGFLGEESLPHGIRPGDLLDFDGDTGDATLEGRGKEGGEEEANDLVTVDPGSSIPSSVKGGTPGGAVVRGRVVRAKGGIPLGGVKVTLARPDSLIAYLRAEANGRFDTLEARTGGDGTFAFTDVTPSQSYALRAFHEDFAVVSHPDALDLRGRGTHDVGDLKMGPGATLEGRVVDEEGAPVKDVRVVVTWRISNPLSVVIVHPDTAPEIEREGRTDKHGKFSIDKLEPVPKTVLVEAPNGAANALISVSLEAGQTRTLEDIVLPGDRYIAGKVIWKDGSGGVRGARVFGAPWQDPLMRSAEVDAEGNFRLEHLAEGENFTIGVLVKGLPVEYAQGFDLDRDDVVIEFDPPGRLEGVVVSAADGKPVTRFGIQLDGKEQPEDHMRRFVEMQVKRGLGPAPFRSPTGAFQFPMVAAGEYVLSVIAPGFPTIRKEGVVVVAGETATVRVEIPSGNVARGRVERTSGGGVAGARLYVIHGGVKKDAKNSQLNRYIEDREPQGATRADGSFELPPQTPGTFDLIAVLEDELPGLLRDVDLRDGDAGGLVVRLPPSGRVKGSILDEAAAPASGEEVYVLYPSGVVRTFHADEGGRFEAGGLPVGRCLVRWVSLTDSATYMQLIYGKQDAAQKRAAYDELRQKGEEHVISDGQVTQVTLRLPPRTKVSGRFRIAGGPPAKSKRRIYFTVEGHGRWIEVEADEHGQYETRLPPGKYLVYVPTSEFEYDGFEVEVPDAATHVLDLDAP